MLDDFFVRALLAGIGVALVAGPLGCVVVWRRLSYFGDTLAHAALLGVAMAVASNVSFIVAVLLVSLVISLALIVLERKRTLSSDSLLGLLSHSTLAIGLIVLSLMSGVRVDLQGLLFGDILAVNKTDLAMIYGGGVIILALLWSIWLPLVAATLNEELAAAEGQKPALTRFVFVVALAGTIAIAMKIVGILLITAMLIIPAATSRLVSRSPEEMAIFASLGGVVAVVSGLFGSLKLDTPSGPTIVVAGLFLFLFTNMATSLYQFLMRARHGSEKG